MSEKKIFLIGFMGSGKSTIAKNLRINYGWKQIEMDAEIEKQEGMKISQIFEQKGEEYFRELETSYIKGLKEESHMVVSCGGGVPMRAVNVEEMRRQGKVIWLTASPETVLQRIGRSHNRPLLEGRMNVEYIGDLLSQREPKYRAAADCIVRTDGKTSAKIAEEIMERISD